MWPKRERERGFNQSKLIAEVLSKIVHHPVVHILKKIKDNKSQVGLNLKEREENVKGAFVYIVPPGGTTPGKVLLVDDVYTTGATARECLKVLRKAGAKNAWVFTLARKLNL